MQDRTLPLVWGPSEIDKIEQQLMLDVLNNPEARFNMRLAALERNIDPDKEPDRAWANYLDEEIAKRLQIHGNERKRLRTKRLISRVMDYVEQNPGATWHDIYNKTDHHYRNEQAMRRAIKIHAPELAAEIRNRGRYTPEAERAKYIAQAREIMRDKRVTIHDAWLQLDPPCGVCQFGVWLKSGED